MRRCIECRSSQLGFCKYIRCVPTHVVLECQWRPAVPSITGDERAQFGIRASVVSSPSGGSSRSPAANNVGAFLANVNSRSHLLYAVARPSVVCLSSVGNARTPYSGGCNFPQYFNGVWVSWPSADVYQKFYRDRPRGTSLSRELNPRGVVKYSDFGPIEGYISETVQDGR